MKSQKYSRRVTLSCPHSVERPTIYYEIVAPSSRLPESPLRINFRSCNQMVDCRLLDKTACPAGIQPLNQYL